MEKPIFDLLIKISSNDFINTEDKSGIHNYEKSIKSTETQRQLDYLLNQGLISETGTVYVITEYGFLVSQFKNWNKYLTHKKSLIDKKIKREHNDLKISEFQVKTKLFPLFLSVISILISLIAIFDPFNFKSNENILLKKEKLNRNIQKDTVYNTILNRLDTVKSSHKTK